MPVAPASPLCWCSSWSCTTGDLSFEQLTQRGNFCMTECVHCGGSGSLFFVCLFVCLLGVGFLIFLEFVVLPKWLLTARLNNFCPPYPPRLSFYNLILLWTVTRVCLDIVSPNVVLTHISCSAVFYPYLSLFTPLFVIFLQIFLCFV